MTVAYEPSARFDVRQFDVEYGRREAGPLLARVYQPAGEGPFPLLLFVHGGAWNNGDRFTTSHFTERLAASGVVVVSPDFRLAPDHPYPAQVQDVNLATRWLKAHAAELKADADALGGMGASSGGHTLLLSAMRPTDPRYAADPLPEALAVDAGVRYVVGLWPVLDPWARYEFARTTPAAGEGFGGAETKLRQTRNYFLTDDQMHEGNPQEILERGEAVALPPVLIIQGTDDMNFPLSSPQRFVPAYRAVGGEAGIEWFPGSPHGFGANPGPATDRALSVVARFIAERLAGVGQVAVG